MRKNGLWLYVLSVFVLSGFSHASASDIKNDEEPLSPKQVTSFEANVDWAMAMIYKLHKCQSNAANASYIPDFVHDNIPMSVLISIPLKQPEDFATQVSNLIWLGLSIESIDIPSLSSSNQQRASAECYIEAARTTKRKLSSTVGDVNFETAIDDLISIGQLLMSAALVLGQDYKQNKNTLLHQSLDYYNRATDLLGNINEQQSNVYARKMTAAIDGVYGNYQKLRMSQN